MTHALEKSIFFLVLILIGVLLKKKIKNQEVNGLKTLILTLALPATIFIALLKIQIDTKFLLYPLLALALNGLLFFITPFLLKTLHITQPGSVASARLLIPSLAPGLSCFPFILEFLGDDYLAKAAIADLGNKFFVLFILYMVAIRWQFKNLDIQQEPLKIKFKKLTKTLILEPVNIFIAVALILVFFGVTLKNLPLVIQDTLGVFSYIMTPLVLIFIGLAVKLKKKQGVQIFSLLMLRAAIPLFAIGLISAFYTGITKPEITLMLVFSLSACSFWPFAHISNILSKEVDVETEMRTFDLNFALTILALSLPVSVVLILGILTSGPVFTEAPAIFILGSILMGIGLIPKFYIWAKSDLRFPKEKVVYILRKAHFW